jgi:hypothetical protein
LKAKPEKSTIDIDFEIFLFKDRDFLLKKLIGNFSFFVLAEIDEFSSTTYESIGDGTNNNNNNASSSPESSDDFVLVPNNLPAVDAQAYERKYVHFE